MKKVVINVCFGGFSLSTEAYEELIKMGIPYSEEYIQTEEPMIFKCETHGYLNEIYPYFDNFTDKNREHPLLVKVVEKLKEKSWGMCAKLKVVKIPGDVDYYIHEYDGNETIHEKHRSWD